MMFEWVVQYQVQNKNININTSTSIQCIQPSYNHSPAVQWLYYLYTNEYLYLATVIDEYLYLATVIANSHTIKVMSKPLVFLSS